MNKLLPLGNRVIVRESKAKEKIGSIFLPEGAQRKPQEGIVVFVSKQLEKELPIGTKIIYGKYAGTSLKYNQEDLLIITENEIMVILTDD